MQHTRRFSRVAIMATAMMMFAFPLPGAAVAVGTEAQVIITELQTGQTSGSDEFVELYNLGTTPVDLQGWQLRYRNAAAGGEGTTLLAALTGAAAIIPPQGYLVVHTSMVPVPAGTAAQTYDAAISPADKAVGLYTPDKVTCTLHVTDAVAWGASTRGEGTALGSPAGAVQLHIDRLAPYTDTNNNTADFVVSGAAGGMATPGALNSTVQASSPTGTTSVSNLPPAAMSDCVVPGREPSAPPATASPEPAAPPAPQSPPAMALPQPEEGEPEEPLPDDTSAALRNAGLYAPQLSELLPNPARPQTDAQDEFIELYNANTTIFDLSGCVLQAGTTAKKHYTFPEGSLLQPKSFTAFYTKDTKLTLSNTAGQVWLLDPLQRVIAQSDPYQNAKDGQAWMAGDTAWQWTVDPSPGDVNVVHAPATKKKAAAAAKSSAKAGTTGSKGASAAGAVQGASTDKPAITRNGELAASTADDEHFNPLHPAILAVTGVIAILYGLYEYRHDLANKFHQFRANRSARRKARPSAERRGGD